MKTKPRITLKILNFVKRRISTFENFQNGHLNCPAKFLRNILNECRDITFLRKFKMAVANMVNFANAHQEWCTMTAYVYTPNLVLTRAYSGDTVCT